MKARAAAALTAAGVSALLLAAPARAAGPMSFEIGDCTAYVSGTGPMQFYCEYNWTGGTDPYTSSATANSTEVHITQVQATNGHAVVFGTCLKGHASTVTLSLKDATGATGAAQASLLCWAF